MYKPTLYLETTCFNFYILEKPGTKRDDTRKLFALIKGGQYEAFTSSVVEDEIADDTPERYKKMKALIDEYHIKMLLRDSKADALAALYIDKGIVPAKYDDDAIHIALATVNRLDFVVSYNMGHIVKTKTMIGTGFVNLRAGYKMIGLSTPTEVIDYD
ncbi:MAG: hypothetical protein LBM77_04000 [Spirochaetaceae bacterium]|jgi:hypothetical protein|nr:hypothetical protein [Spirochaetaceae bacterium]